MNTLLKENIIAINESLHIDNGIHFNSQRRLFEYYEEDVLHNLEQNYLCFTDCMNIESTLAISFRPDGKYFATGSSDHLVRVFEYPSGCLKCILAGHDRSTISIRWHPTNPLLLASASIDSRVIIWNINTCQQLYSTIIDVNKETRSIDFHPNADLLVIGSKCSVFIWDYKSNCINEVYNSSPMISAYVRFVARGHGILIVKKYKHDNPNSIVIFISFHIKPSKLNDPLIHYEIILPDIIISKEAYLYSENGFDISSCGLYLIISLTPEYISNPTAYSSCSSFGPYMDYTNRYKYYYRSKPVDILSNAKSQYQQFFRHSSSSSSPNSLSSSSEHISIGDLREVVARVALLSLEPKTFGKILDYVNIKEQSEIITLQFSPSNNYIVMTNAQPEWLHKDAPVMRILRVTDWNIIYEYNSTGSVPNTAVFSINEMGIIAGFHNSPICIFRDNCMKTNEYIKKEIPTKNSRDIELDNENISELIIEDIFNNNNNNNNIEFFQE